MNKVQVNLIGAGGHARSVASLLLSEQILIAKYFDDSGSDVEQLLGHITYGGDFAAVSEDTKVVLGIGDNLKRQTFFEQYNVFQSPIIHTTAVVDARADVASGTLIFAGAHVCVEASIGENCIINTRAVVEHESVIGHHCHVSIGALVAGRVKIGDTCFIGAGAIIKDKITITSNVIIGAGAVVVDNIDVAGTYVGIPARRIK